MLAQREKRCEPLTLLTKSPLIASIRQVRAMASEPIESDLPLPEKVVQVAVPYPDDAKPAFVGRYWLSGRQPELLRQNIACVDWSIAKGGFLCAYRWDGERELDAGKFVWA